MAKLNARKVRAAIGHGPVAGPSRAAGPTYEGGAGYARDLRSEPLAGRTGLDRAALWTAAGRWTFGGLCDAGFGMIPLLEAGRHGGWPF
jgi:hypothetical protein